MSFKRQKLLAALLARGVEVVREGGSHTIVQRNGRRTQIPRHRELDRVTSRKLVEKLGLDWSEVEPDVR